MSENSDGKSRNGSGSSAKGRAKKQASYNAKKGRRKSGKKNKS